MTTTTKRKAAPRKKVPVKSNGHAVNGEAAAVAPPPAAPVEAAEEPVFNPYGTKQLYRFKPQDGSGEIVFPHISEINADAYFFWKIYNLNEMFQAFEWMEQAKVPRWVQERVMKLPDDEKREFFAGWFSAVVQPQGVSPPGES